MSACERLKLMNQHLVQPNKSAQRTAPHRLPINPLNQTHVSPTTVSLLSLVTEVWTFFRKLNSGDLGSRMFFWRKPSIFFPLMDTFLHGYSVALKFCRMHWPFYTPWYLAFPEPIIFHSLKAISEETIAFSRTTDVYMTMTGTRCESDFLSCFLILCQMLSPRLTFMLFIYFYYYFFLWKPWMQSPSG